MKTPLEILDQLSQQRGYTSWSELCKYQQQDGMNMVPQEACIEYAKELKEDNRTLGELLHKSDQRILELVKSARFALHKLQQIKKLFRPMAPQVVDHICDGISEIMNTLDKNK